MKVCCRCKVEKSVDCFSLKRSGVPQSYCKECNSAYQKAHYAANKQKYKDKAKARTDAFREEMRKYKESHPCTDCGVQYPYYVMQFDHLEDKEFDMATQWAYSRKRVQAEMEKCELVCANCHMERTHQRRIVQ